MLYGGGTSGGVVNIITKTPTSPLNARVSSKISSYSTAELGAGVSTLFENGLFAKLSTKANDSKTHRYGEKIRHKFSSATLGYEFNDNNKILLDGSYLCGDLVIADNLTYAQLMDSRNKTYTLSALKTTQKALSVTYDGDFTDYFSTSIKPFYQETKTHYKDNTADFADKKVGVNFKNRLEHTLGSLVFGYDFIKNTGLRVSRMDYARLSPIIISGGHEINIDLQKQTHSAFLLERFEPTQNLSFMAGYRFERANYDVKRNSDVNVVMSRPISIKTQIDGKRTMNNYAFELGTNYSLNEYGNIYAKFERGYITPTPAQLIDRVSTGSGPRAASVYVFNNLIEEIFNSYELGYRNLIFGELLSFTLFLTDTKDEIIDDLPNSHISTASMGGETTWRFYNIDKTRRLGFELAYEQNFGKFSFTQALSMTNAKIQNGENKGKQVPLTSKTKASIGAKYTPIKPLEIFSRLKYLSSYQDTEFQSQSGRTLVDVGFNYEVLKGLKFGAGIKNLFNKKNITPMQIVMVTTLMS